MSSPFDCLQKESFSIGQYGFSLLTQYLLHCYIANIAYCTVNLCISPLPTCVLLLRISQQFPITIKCSWIFVSVLISATYTFVASHMYYFAVEFILTVTF